jgi:beta-glucanase (GH16 family)
MVERGLPSRAGRARVPILILAGGLLAAPGCHGDPPAGSDSPAGAPGEWTLVWSDEFDSGSTPVAPDAAHWGHEIGYVRNREWQYYTDDIRNAYCQDGFLHIEAHRHPPGTFPTGGEEGQDGSISSASLTSRDRVQFQFGRLEMRARIDTRWGSWPAFWSLGARGEWPDNGECDIMEYYKEQLLFNVAWWKAGDKRWTPRWDGEKVRLDTLPASWADEFHTWAMEWDTTGVRLTMDDVLYNEWDSSLDSGDASIEGFQQEHFFILNQAIGGTAGGDASGLAYPTSYVVDYVRLYERVLSP